MLIEQVPMDFRYFLNRLHREVAKQNPGIGVHVRRGTDLVMLHYIRNSWCCSLAYLETEEMELWRLDVLSRTLRYKALQKKEDSALLLWYHVASKDSERWKSSVELSSVSKILRMSATRLTGTLRGQETPSATV